MDIIFQLLDWAKDKDLSELYYENRSGSTPICIQLQFSPVASNGAVSYYCNIHSPAIGQLTWNPALKPGAVVVEGEVLGLVKSEGGQTEIRSQSGGKILEVQVASGSAVGFNQPLLVLELGLGKE